MADQECAQWPISETCCSGDGCCFPADQSTWTDQQKASAAVASETLWRATAGRYGLCEQKVRPCSRGCVGDGYGTLPFRVEDGLPVPVLIDGQWINLGCGCGGPCGCGVSFEVVLPGPVHDVIEIKVDGAVVPAAAYVVRGERSLIRLDGAWWPRCQHLDRPDTEEGTWSIRYRTGREVPPGGVRAVTTLACELLKQCLGNRKCRLPRGVTEIDREGLVLRIDEEEARMLPEVDSWLTLVNPNRQLSSPGVWTPDAAVMQTEPLPGGGAGG